MTAPLDLAALRYACNVAREIWNADAAGKQRFRSDPPLTVAQMDALLTIAEAACAWRDVHARSYADSAAFRRADTAAHDALIDAIDATRSPK